METGTTTLAVNLLDPHSLLSSFGVVGIIVVLVAETGLLIGIVLPGDSLLFTAIYGVAESFPVPSLGYSVVIPARMGGARSRPGS